MTDSNVPEGRLYTEDHEWAELTEGVWTIGITDFAQDQLGDITLVELPEVGTELTAGEAFGTVDSVKTFSDLYAPIECVVVEVNEALLEDPSALNEAPYGAAWLIKVKAGDDAAQDLLDAAAYRKHLESVE